MREERVDFMCVFSLFTLYNDETIFTCNICRHSPSVAVLIQPQRTRVLYVGTKPQWESERKNGTEKDVTGSEAGGESLLLVFTSRPFAQSDLLESWVTPPGSVMFHDI